MYRKNTLLMCRNGSPISPSSPLPLPPKNSCVCWSPSKKKSVSKEKSPHRHASIPFCPIYMATYPFHGIFYFLLGYVRGYMESNVLIAKWYFQCFQNRTGHWTGKVTGSQFTGRTDCRTAIEPLSNRWRHKYIFYYFIYYKKLKN